MEIVHLEEEKMEIRGCTERGDIEYRRTKISQIITIGSVLNLKNYTHRL